MVMPGVVSWLAAVMVPLSLERGAAHVPVYALTFDAHEAVGGAREVLAILRQRQIRVTIFATGRFALRFPEILAEASADGHEIGNHTFSHPHLTTYATDGKQRTAPGVTRQFLHRELLRAEVAIAAAVGRPPAKLWRAPFGEVNGEILQWACELGYVHVGWTRDGRHSLDALDWVADQRSSRFLDPEALVRRLLRALERQPSGGAGSILLMHLGSDRLEPPWPLALPMLLDELDRRGLRPVAAGELITGPAPCAERPSALPR